MNLPEAIQYLSVLADGIDPLTGEQLPEDHICNRGERFVLFIRCLRKSDI